MPRKMTAQTPSDEDVLAYNNVPVDVAAKYIGWPTEHMCSEIKNERVPFGLAAQMNEGRHTYTVYNISPGLLVKYRHKEI